MADMVGSTRSGEFHRIAQLFAPLAAGAPAALGLKDDAAVLSVPVGQELVISADTLVETVHFIGDEPAADLARKALRVNLSDLAAMGAKPLGYFLSLSLPQRIDDAWVAGFCQGLAQDQDAFGCSLMGGDSTTTPGPISLAFTVLGTVPLGGALRRSGARVGDDIYVSGHIGDGLLGLMAVQGRLPPGRDANAVVRRYQLPEPRVALGQALVGRAHAAMDVSDGLVADIGHICAASGVAARIEAPLVPLSDAAAEIVADAPSLYADILTGGDDYELLITGSGDAIKAAAEKAGIAVTRIGAVVSGNGVTVVDSDGAPMAFAQAGYSHS